MSTRQHYFHVGKTAGELSMYDAEWWHHIFAFVYVMGAMTLTYALAMQEVGVMYMVPSVTVSIVGLLYLYGQRLDYLKIGEKVQLGTRAPKNREREQVKQHIDDEE